MAYPAGAKPYPCRAALEGEGKKAQKILSIPAVARMLVGIWSGEGLVQSKKSNHAKKGQIHEEGWELQAMMQVPVSRNLDMGAARIK